MTTDEIIADLTAKNGGSTPCVLVGSEEFAALMASLPIGDGSSQDWRDEYGPGTHGYRTEAGWLAGRRGQ